MKPYRLRPTAEADLDDIWNYTSVTWSTDQANEYVSQLFDMFVTIAGSPALGQRVDSVITGYRRLRCSHHIIYYKILGRGQVEIVRILHEKVDIGRHLDDKP